MSTLNKPQINAYIVDMLSSEDYETNELYDVATVMTDMLEDQAEFVHGAGAGHNILVSDDAWVNARLVAHREVGIR